ncbi:TolB family protein [Virgibacillus halodenitrificans]|jgi:dipeptidyl aminopeptidase/acylaminoacyl peptidase|uniref:TolB family protein n=1 Tax=Virgibacillus halodenitrificans TaxID=1482 RepID=UPI001F39C36D|nr:translocation protein TolB [Virgibacillus halodenitrificans]
MRYRIFLVMVFICICFPIHSAAEKTLLKAAFIRDNQLWLIQDDKETQLTEDRHVDSPKWSRDGRFIAFLDRDLSGDKAQLYIYDLKEEEIYQAYPTIETEEFHWSPVSNQLAYLSGGLLNVTKIRNGRPEGFKNVSLGVSNFNWFPDGKAFIVSSPANLLPTGWEQVHLFKVPVDTELDTDKVKPFYTINTDMNDLFAIDATYFKWSQDGRWMSFLATPTASWAMDSNTLCVLSSTGQKFQAIGKMLWYKDWIQWSPFENTIAFISGEGRFFVENKHTTILDIPVWRNETNYTPPGFVDLDLAWLTKKKVLVARAEENKEWEEGPVPTMFTRLYEINIDSGKQKQISFPKKNELDTDPRVIGSYITWYRSTSNKEQGEIWVKNGVGKSYRWLRNVDQAPAFYYEKPFL